MTLASVFDFSAVILLASAAWFASGRWGDLASRWEAAVLAPFLRLARRPVAAMLACCAAPLVVRALLWKILRIPVPQAVDEYSYLLASDTFAHGRLTNPTHPLWMHFESPNIIQVPSYASKYPPLQGLVMAFGQVVFRHPWWGVFISNGILGAVLYWALAGWVPRRWALLGSFLALLQWEVLGYWMNSYWGGSVAAIGGALLLGGFPRLRAGLRRNSPSNALLMALGVAILANTRPYEGLVFAVPVLIAAARRVFRSPSPVRLRALWPAALMLAVAGGCMAFYFWRVTGKPWKMPYIEHEQQYAIAPAFRFLPLRPIPAYRHPSLAWWWLHDPSLMVRNGAWRPFLELISILLGFYGGWTFLVAFAGLWRLRSAVIRWLGALLLLQFLAMLLLTWPLPHYAAPATALVLLLAVCGLRSLRGWRPEKHPQFGAWMVRVVVIVCVTHVGICGAELFGAPVPGWNPKEWNFRCCSGQYEFVRSEIEQGLEARPDRHLVVVSYSAEPSISQDVVYNLADIDSQRIVWARSMNNGQNRPLLEYYKDRYVWLLTVNAGHYRLMPYPGTRPPL
jgi:hypothetical protein